MGAGGLGSRETAKIDPSKGSPPGRMCAGASAIEDQLR